MKHWLHGQVVTDNNTLSGTLSTMAGPVADPTSDRRINPVLYSYYGQTSPDTIGTLKRVTATVWNWPIQDKLETPRNTWGRPVFFVLLSQRQPGGLQQSV